MFRVVVPLLVRLKCVILGTDFDRSYVLILRRGVSIPVTWNTSPFACSRDEDTCPWVLERSEFPLAFFVDATAFRPTSCLSHLETAEEIDVNSYLF